MRKTSIIAIAAIACTLPVCTYGQAEEQESPYELISIARFGERATAVIGIGENGRRLVKLGGPLANTGYTLTEVDVSYVELTKDGEVITLILDKADEASIARRKAARDARQSEEEALAKAEKDKKPEKKKDSKAIANLRGLLSKRVEKWEFDGSDIQGIATSLRKWTRDENGKSLLIRVLSHRGAEPVSVRASGADNTVTDILNMLNKDFSVPYAATPDGKIVLGNGYTFRRHLVKPDQSVDDIAQKYNADSGLIGELNSGKIKFGKAIIVPVPTNP